MVCLCVLGSVVDLILYLYLFGMYRSIIFLGHLLYMQVSPVCEPNYTTSLPHNRVIGAWGDTGHKQTQNVQRCRHLNHATSLFLSLEYSLAQPTPRRKLDAHRNYLVPASFATRYHQGICTSRKIYPAKSSGIKASVRLRKCDKPSFGLLSLYLT